MELSTQDLAILLLLFMKGTLLSAWTLKVNIAIYKEKKINDTCQHVYIIVELREKEIYICVLILRSLTVEMLYN